MSRSKDDTVAYACSPVAGVGVSTQAAPTNRSSRAPSTPSCSEPAIGSPPTTPAEGPPGGAGAGGERPPGRDELGDGTGARPEGHRNDREIGAARGRRNRRR